MTTLNVDDVFSRTRVRAPALDRIVRGFPLPRVNMTAPVGPGDFDPGKRWPPTRVQARGQRLATFDDWFDGDITGFVGDKTSATLVVNYFERIATVFAAILLTSEPAVPLVDRQMVRMLLSDAAVNALRSGRAYMIRAGDTLASTETSSCFDGPSGRDAWCVTRSTSLEATDSKPDQATVVYAQEGLVVTRLQAWQSGTVGRTTGQFGPILDTTTLDGDVARVDRAPRRFGFGRSLFESMAPVVIAQAIRLAGIDRTIAQNEHPLLAIPIANADAATSLGSEGAPSKLRDFGKPEVVKAAQAMRDHDVIWAPDGVSMPKYVEWGATSTSASFELLQVLAEEISVLTGLPRALVGGGELPSGVAMKRLLFALYATSRHLWGELHDAGQKVYGAEFDWPHPFDVDEEAGRAMADMMADDPDAAAEFEANSDLSTRCRS